jgi:glycosyltransferase EpsH
MSSKYERPKVSVIVPVYNVEKYLYECLSSLVCQTLIEIEIIVINDGSTDTSWEVIQEFANRDSRIKPLNQPNSGVSLARKRGVLQACGEYIGFVDSDDWVDENMFTLI